MFALRLLTQEWAGGMKPHACPQTTDTGSLAGGMLSQAALSDQGRGLSLLLWLQFVL